MRGKISLRKQNKHFITETVNNAEKLHLYHIQREKKIHDKLFFPFHLSFYFAFIFWMMLLLLLPEKCTFLFFRMSQKLFLKATTKAVWWKFKWHFYLKSFLFLFLFPFSHSLTPSSLGSMCLCISRSNFRVELRKSKKKRKKKVLFFYCHSYIYELIENVHMWNVNWIEILWSLSLSPFFAQESGEKNKWQASSFTNA